jgi:hypothetical protein
MPSPDDPHSLAAYEAAMLTAIVALTARLARGGVLLDQLPEQMSDASWRVAASAEFRAWRIEFDALPAESPVAYAAVHARLVRWAGVLAEVGDDFAAAIEARSVLKLHRASRKMARVPAFYRAMQQALVEAVEQLES